MTLFLLLSACAARANRGLDTDLIDPPSAARTDDPRVVLEAAAADTDPNPRARALALLALHDPPEAGWIARGLYDPEPWVGATVVAALEREGRLADAGVAAVIAPFLAGGGDAHVRAMLFRATDPAGAVAACAASPSAWRADPLCLVAAEAGDAASRERLVADLAARVPFDPELLADLGRSGLDVAPALRGVEAEEEIAVAWTAALTGLGDAGARAALLEALRDPDEGVRLSALDAATLLPGDVAVDVLRRARRGGSPLLRMYPPLALAVHGHGGLDAVERAARHADREVRRLAYALAADVDARPAALAELAARGLSDDDPEVRRLALALASTRHLALDPAAVAKAMQDDYLDVRVEAAGYRLASP